MEEQGSGSSVNPCENGPVKAAGKTPVFPLQPIHLVGAKEAESNPFVSIGDNVTTFQARHLLTGVKPTRTLIVRSAFVYSLFTSSHHTQI